MMIRAMFVSCETSLNVANNRHPPRRASWLRSRNTGWCGKRVTEGRTSATTRDGRGQRRREFCPLFCQREDNDIEIPRYQDEADAVAKGLGGTNLYLVGMMGSGKTTVGSMLAKSLNYLFMDSDDLIEKAAKCSVHEYFKTYGEEAFRELETAVLRDLHQYKNLVVGTGGGIVTDQMNWSYLHQGIVVFLNASPEKLAQRVAKDELHRRPLLSQTSEEDKASDPVDIAKKNLTRIYAERERFYKNADIEVSLEDPLSPSGLASVDETITRLLSQLKRRMDDAKRQREEKRNYEIRGLTDLSEGKTTINVPATDRDAPEGF